MTTDPLAPLARALFNRQRPDDDEPETPQATEDPEQTMREFVSRLFATDDD